MNCREFLALLDAGDAPLPAAADTHAAACPACARARERWELTRRELRALAEEAPPPFLAERVMARVRAERERTAVPALARLRPALAAAVLVVASVAGFALWTALRDAGTPVQEARSAGGAQDKRELAKEDAAAAGAAATAVTVPTAPAAQVARRAAPPPPRQRDKGEPRVVAAAAEKRAGPAPVRDAATEAAVAPAAPAEAPVVGGIAPPPNRERERDETAAREAAPEARASRAEPALARLEAAPAATEPRPALVLVGREDGTRRSLPGAAGAGPAPGERWTVVVGRDGAVTLLDGAGRELGGEHGAVLAAIRTLAPPAGTYLLLRP